MAKQQLMVIMLSLTILCGCGNKSNSNNKSEKRREDFYEKEGGWDWIRVPLIKPYEIIKVDPKIEENGWGIKLQSDLYQVDKAKRVDVIDSIIFIVSGKVDNKDHFTAIGTRNVPTAWFVIDTKKQIEKGFADELEFKKYLQENKYPAPNWHSIDSLSKVLSEGSQVPWKPK